MTREIVRSRIGGTGMYVPDRVVTNHDLAERMDTSDEWIRQRSGIEQRHWVEGGVGSSDLAKEASDQIGARPWLDQFEKRRHRDITARAKVIDLYNRVCRSEAPPIQALRSLGLTLVHDVAPLRQGVMRAGLGG